jgi:hypothetical protein
MIIRETTVLRRYRAGPNVVCSVPFSPRGTETTSAKPIERPNTQ